MYRCKIDMQILIYNKQTHAKIFRVLIIKKGKKYEWCITSVKALTARVNIIMEWDHDMRRTQH